MRRAIATVTLGGSLPEKLRAIAQAGFEEVELLEQDLTAHVGGPREAAAMAADLGLRFVCFQPFRDFEGLPAALRAAAIDRAESRFDLMQEIGCPLLLLCSSVHPEADGDPDRIADDLRLLGSRAAARGLRIGYEALSWGRHVNDYRQSWHVVRDADHASVGLVLDSFHTLARGDSLDAIRAIPAERIFLVQVADAPRLEMELLPWSRHHRCLPGQGDLDVAAFTEALAATGYDGLFSLEIFSDRFRAACPITTARDGQRSLVALLDAVRRRGRGH